MCDNYFSRVIKGISFIRVHLVWNICDYVHVFNKICT
jgi:hypothetical protein